MFTETGNSKSTQRTLRRARRYARWSGRSWNRRAAAQAPVLFASAPGQVA